MKNNSPLVTIGIPTYNRPQGLARTLRCITQQTHKNLEIIVSDNCSPDPKVSEVGRNFVKIDPRVQYFRQAKNVGAALNFQFVLGKATAEYFMWAADDDEWEPTFVEKCLQAFDEETVLVFPHSQSYYRKQGIGKKIVMPKLSKDKSKFENLMALYKDFAPSIIYGLHRTDNLKEVFGSGYVFDFIGYWWQTKILLSGDITIIDDLLYTAGIDEKAYVKKSFSPAKNRNFIYLPCIFAVLRLIRTGPFRLIEKLRLSQRILAILCHSYLVYEKEYALKTVKNGLKYLSVGMILLVVQPNLPQAVVKHLWAFASNPRQFLAELWQKFFTHDYFYWKLLIKGTVEYDRLNKTYVRDVKGNRFHLNPSDVGISRVLARDGIREKESVDALCKYVTPDMTVIEIGANIGFYVVLEAKIISKGKGKIIAIEPCPKNIELLELNVKANNYGNIVSIYQGAIFNKTGMVKLKVSPLSNCHRLASLSSDDSGSDYRIVPSFTFPDFLKHAGISIEQLDFLRMDVEGAEYEILPSIFDLLERKRSFLMFIEFHPEKGNLEKHKEVLKKLEFIGFVCLTATKEYVKNGKIARLHLPHTSIRQLYTEGFFMQQGGCEVFLKK